MIDDVGVSAPEPAEVAEPSSPTLSNQLYVIETTNDASRGKYPTISRGFDFGVGDGVAEGHLESLLA